jgi:excinuclease ABC A subunit
MKNITIKGARIHNLKNIDVTIPKNQLVVATGVSGSGKSSLMFDLVFEEGRRLYLKSLGVLTDIDDEEKYESVSGLGPTIAVQQSIIRQSNPRSTVGSNCGMLNLLCLLFAGEGRILCSNCGTLTDPNLVCPNCGNKEERLPPNYFSYNAPNGMCIKCSGHGSYYILDIETLIPDDHITLRNVFINAGATPGYIRLLERKYGAAFNTAFASLPDHLKHEVIHGQYNSTSPEKRSYCLTRIYHGHLLRNRMDVEHMYHKSVCPECQGYRIGPEARRVLLGNHHIGELGMMTIAELQEYLAGLAEQGNFSQYGINLLRELQRKTVSLMKARLGHLALYREMPSLSGGEIQRLFLTRHLDSNLDSLIYILDEPTSGLHEAEKRGMLQSIIDLKNLGNTVIVVEHDRNTIEMADHIIDIGPKAGTEGGWIVYQGDVKGLLACPDSITGRYLSGKLAMPTRPTRIIDLPAHPCVTVRHAKTNNLKDISVSFPLGCLVGVAGMSGCGKSSLVSHTLIPLLKGYFHDPTDVPEIENEESDPDTDEGSDYVQTIADRLDGASQLSGFAEISQAPIGRNINSIPATYIGIWDKIRKLFAQQPSAVQSQLTAGHFSFNSKGACPTCGGSGTESIWLGGNQSISKTCGECHGKRYGGVALAVTYKGKNIYEVLEMTVSEAVGFFKDQRGISPVLHVMDKIGMGYIKLGQPTPTLSGGEAQRIKLAKEIGKKRKGNILYVMDEPTTGLSLYDTAKLISLVEELVAKGNSVIVVEHDPDFLKVCDWVIELGPGGGAEGGSLIAQGSPEMLRHDPRSITGGYL